MTIETKTTSKGHLFFYFDFEYFAFEGNIYRANKNNPLDTKGFRNGARWENKLSRLESLKSILGI